MTKSEPGANHVGQLAEKQKKLNGVKQNADSIEK